MPALLSMVIMRLKMGHAGLASQLYERLLRLPELTEAQRQLAARKLVEAEAAAKAEQPPMVRRARLQHASMTNFGTMAPLAMTHPLSHPRQLEGGISEEVMQLLAPEQGATALEPEEVGRLIQLMQHLGHRTNRTGNYHAAQGWFDGAFALSQHASDLLSAANMRQKLAAGSPLAEALYRHILTMPGQDERKLLMAARKLADVQLQRSGCNPTGAALRNAH